MSPAGQTQVAAVILAAGRSTRMGTENKLLADIGGRPMVRAVAEAALASRARPLLVVTGHQQAQVQAALAALDLAFVANPDFATGLAGSLKAGIGALPDMCGGALVLLGDMPLIEVSHIDRLIAAFGPGAIVVPVSAGRQGNPVVWPRSRFPELMRLEGDAGAKRLIAAHRDQVREVEIASTAIFADADTPEALQHLREGGAIQGGQPPRFRPC